jgi:intergrase/recombinase
LQPVLVRYPRFEPWSPAWQTDDNGQQLTVEWDRFEDWLRRKKYRKKVMRDMLSYARRFNACLLQRDLSKVAALSDGLRPNVMKALSALAKFLGVNDEYRKLIKKYGLKWGGRKADDLIIDRLTKVEKPEEVFRWICMVKAVRPDLTEFMDLMACTGLRLVEAVNSYNLIIKLSREGRLDEYYQKEKGLLEHFRFKELFIRRSKKAFISFVPAELIQRIQENSPLTSADAVQKLVQKKGLQLRFADIRETHATFMIKYLHREEIDFLHGRVTTNVFMENYFNPAMIVDLQARALGGIREINEKVKK